MRFSLSFKILGPVAAVLILMIGAAVFSVHYTNRVGAEMDLVNNRSQPMIRAMTLIETGVLEQNALFQHLFMLAKSDDKSREIAEGQDRLTELGERLSTELDRVERSMASTPLGPEGHRLIDDISVTHQAFEEQGTLLLAMLLGGDEATFYALLPDMNSLLSQIADLTHEVQNHFRLMADRAAGRIEHEANQLLIINLAFSAIAVFVALWFSYASARRMSQSVRNLIAGSKSVESGDFELEISATSRDEIGDLTRSFNQMARELLVKERIKDIFGRYMDPGLVSNLMEQPELLESGGERRELTIMVIDLKGFATIMEKLEPDDLIALLDDFFSYLTTIISEQMGVVDKFLGDTVIAYWSRPFCPPDRHAALACHAALQASSQLDTFRGHVRAKLGGRADGFDLDFRIGIATGDAIIGSVGSKASRSFTVIGDPIDLGIRLEGANKAYGSQIMLSDRTRQLAGDEFQVRELDMIRVKGKRDPFRIYELLTVSDKGPSEKTAGRTQFETGLRAYRRREWDAAETAFCASMAERAHDPACRVYLERIAYLRNNPPPSGWDGVWMLEANQL